jgi:hypothetical protein
MMVFSPQLAFTIYIDAQNAAIGLKIHGLSTGQQMAWIKCLALGTGLA